MKRINRFLLATAFFAGLFVSCEIGLGPAVDTEAPSLAIAFPDVSGVAGNDFSIYGTCTDDVKVDRLVIKGIFPAGLELNDQNNSLLKEDVSFSPDSSNKNWLLPFQKVEGTKSSYMIGKLETPVDLPDGSYTVKFVAIDTSERSSSDVYRSFDIDNTPPVFLVETPGSIEGGEGKSDFGTTVTVSGQIADSHTVTDMDIKVYRKNGDNYEDVTSKLSKTNFNGFDAANTSVVIARYVADTTDIDEDSRILRENYLAMFGIDKNSDFEDISKAGTQEVLLSVKLTDKAGNVCDNVYISSLMKSFMPNLIKSYNAENPSSLVDENTTLKANDYSKVLSNVMDEDNQIQEGLRAKIEDALLGKLDGAMPYLSRDNELGQSRMRISLNPNTSPSYTISATVDYKDEKYEWPQITPAKTTFSVQIKSGLEGFDIVPSKLSLHIYEAVENGEGVFDGKYNPEKLVAKLDSDSSEDDKKCFSDETNHASVFNLNTGTKSASYQFSLSGYSGINELNGGARYIIVLKGQDEKGNVLIPTATFGFHVASSGAAPVVELADQSLKFKKASEIGKSFKELELRIRDKESKNIKNSGGENALRYEVTYYAGTDDTGTVIDSYSGAIRGSDIEDLGSNEYRTSIPLRTIDLSKMNRTCTIVVSVKARNFMAESDFMDFMFYGDNGAPNISVTNPPTIISSSVEGFRKDNDGCYYELTGKWSDEEGSETDTIYFSTISATEGFDSIPNATTPQVSSPEATWRYDIPLTEGDHKFFYLKAKDKVGNESGVVKIENVVVDYKAPTLEKISPAVVEKYYAQNLVLKFEAQDSYKVKDIIVKAKKNDGGWESYPAIVTPSASATKKTCTVELSAEEGAVWEISVQAVDEGGQKSQELHYSTTIEKNPPVFKNVLVDDVVDYENVWFKNTTLRVKGTIFEDKAGLDKIYYLVTSSTDSEINGVTNLSTVLSDEEKGRYASEISVSGFDKDIEFSISPLGLSESSGTSSNVIWIQAVDKAGNLSLKQRLNIKIDQTYPDSGAKFYGFDSTSILKIDGTVLHPGYDSTKLDNKELYIYGTVKEEQSGTDSIKIKIDDTLIANAIVVYGTATKTSSADDFKTIQFVENPSDKIKVNVWRAKIPSQNVRSGNVKIVTRDVSGNENTQSAFLLEVDNEAPTIILTAPAKNDRVNGKISVYGTASDNASLKSVEAWHYTDNNPTPIPMGDKKEGADAFNWRYDNLEVTKKVTSGFEFSDGTAFTGEPKNIYVKVVATDTAGNESVETFIFVADPDSDRSVITINNLDVSSDDPSKIMSDANRIWLKDSSLLYGIVNDDDGVSELKWRTGDDGVNGWKTCELNNGAWTLDLDKEGPVDVFFQVKDFAGNTFESSDSGSSKYSTPKVQDGNGKSSGDLSVVYLRVDKTPPVLSNPEYQVYNRDNNSWGALDSSGKWKTDAWSTDFTAYAFGGRYIKVKFRCQSSDDNDIESVKITMDKDYLFHNTTGDNYESEEIDISSIDSDTYVCPIVAEDKAGMTMEKTVNIVVDNKSPEVEISSPSGGARVSKAFTSYGTVDEAGSELYFAVTLAGKDADTITDFATGAQNAANRWQKIKDASLSWTVFFDDDVDEKTTHTSSVLEYMSSEFGVGEYKFDEVMNTRENILNMIYGGTVPLTLHVRAIDKSGNVGDSHIDLTADPQSTRPSMRIINPVNGATLGGTIMLMGTATDDEEPNYVWIMLDLNNDGEWNYSDIEKIKATDSNFEFGKFDATATSESERFKTIDISDIPSDAPDYSIYAIRCPVNGASWNLTLNDKDQFTDKNGAVEIGVFAYVTDKEGNHSFSSVHKMTEGETKVYFKIDGDAPRIENQYIRKYDDGGNLVAEKAYSDGMAIRGKWYYEADIFDDSGLDDVTIGSVKMADSTGILPSGRGILDATLSPNAPSNVKGYHLKYPIGKDDDSSVEKIDFDISFTEKKSERPIEKKIPISLRLDNMKPVLAPSTSPDYKLSPSSVKRWVNNNGFFTFGSTVSEKSINNIAQTGATRVAFYITKEGYIYDIMEMGRKTPFNERDRDSEDGLVWKSTSATASGSATIFVTDTTYAKKGGLAKVNGVIYRIADVSGSNVTLDTAIGETFSGSPSVSFAIASVVDNSIQESEMSGASKNENGYYDFSNINFDDGDGMVEGFIKQGTTWTWSATVNTKVLGDGVAKLHYVAFDNAGNASTDVVDIFIGNNQPRVVGVVVASDDDNDGKYSEVETYTSASRFYTKGVGGAGNGLDAVGNVVTKAMFPLSSTEANPKKIFTIKNGLMVQPEVVGGNGTLKYEYAVYQRSGSSWSSSATGKSSAPTDLKTPMDTVAQGTDLESSSDIVTGLITMDAWDLKSAGVQNGDNQKFALRILDSTPGKSMDAEIDLVLGFDIDDEDKPVTKIRPFYWNSKTDNSLFAESSDYGHIELPRYIKSANKNPQVSGKIKVEGIAQDNIQLGEISISIAGKSVKLAEYKKISGEWEWIVPSTLDEDGELLTDVAASITQVSYGEAVALGIMDECPDETTEDMLIPYFSQETGHIVKWIAYIDTEKMMELGLETVIQAVATDRGSPSGTKGSYGSRNPSQNDSDQSGGVLGDGIATNKYTVMSVPYITSLETTLSKIMTDSPSVYGRSSSGKYAIHGARNEKAALAINPEKDDGEIVSVKGFNLSGGVVNILCNGTEVSSDGLNVEAKVLNNGILSVKIDGVESINNINDNDAPYNVIDNEMNNSNLNDDVEIQLWEFKNMATKATNNLTFATVKVNPLNGILGASFGNMFFYNMPGYTKNDNPTLEQMNAHDIEQWYSQTPFMFGNNGCTEGTFAFDENGVSYGGIQYQSSDGDALTSGNGAFHFIMKEGVYLPIDVKEVGGRYGFMQNFGSRLEGNTAGILKAAGTSVNSKANFFRVTSPSFVAKTQGDGSTMMYIAYVDTQANQIRFRRGKVLPNEYEIPDTTKGNDTWHDSSAAFKAYKDESGNATLQGSSIRDIADFNDVKIGTNSFGNVNETGLGMGSKAANSGTIHQAYKFPYTSTGKGDSKTSAADSIFSMSGQAVHVIAGSDTSYTDVNELYKASTYNGDGYGYYCSLAVTSDGTAVVAWYDADANSLKVSYNTEAQLSAAETDALEMSKTKEYASLSEVQNKLVDLSKKRTNVWHSHVKTVSSSGGTFVRIAIDSDDTLHMAYVDGGLKYAYMKYNSSTKTFGEPVVMTVDSYGSVGNYLSLEVGKKDGKQVPFIAYYSSSRAKYATCVSYGSDGLPKGDGAVDGIYTGDWEVTYVPSKSGVSQSTVNVAAWIDKDKNLKDIEAGTDYAELLDKEAPTRVPGYSSRIYGNGTSNPVVAYITTSGNLEMGQIKE